MTSVPTPRSGTASWPVADARPVYWMVSDALIRASSLVTDSGFVDTGMAPTSAGRLASTATTTRIVV